MIYISQGHEKGIGLEIFIKSFLCLNQLLQKNFILSCNLDSLKDTLISMNIKFTFKGRSVLFKSVELQCSFLKESKSSQTLTSLLECMDKMKEDDFLVTLPSSKDQFFYNDKHHLGHTEFFRHYFNASEVGMNFLSHNQTVTLLTDHVNLSEVEESLLVQGYIVKKLNVAIKSLKKIRKISDVYFSGINPHCGESGRFSNADKELLCAIKTLESTHPDLIFHGPQAGDTLSFSHLSSNQLFVYAHHDQGLSAFKNQNGLLGINFSTGLPFTRVSVDHGTAFDLYGKNTANYAGMSALLSEVLKWQKNTPHSRGF